MSYSISMLMLHDLQKNLFMLTTSCIGNEAAFIVGCAIYLVKHKIHSVYLAKAGAAFFWAERADGGFLCRIGINGFLG